MRAGHPGHASSPSAMVKPTSTLLLLARRRTPLECLFAHSAGLSARLCAFYSTRKTLQPSRPSTAKATTTCPAGRSNYGARCVDHPGVRPCEETVRGGRQRRRRRRRTGGSVDGDSQPSARYDAVPRERRINWGTCARCDFVGALVHVVSPSLPS